MDFEAPAFPFTPERIAKAAALARGGHGRRMWRDDNQGSGNLTLIAGPRGAAFYCRGRIKGRKGPVSHKLGDASGPLSIGLAEARRRCLEEQYGGPELASRDRRRGARAGQRIGTVGITIGEAWDAYIDAVTTGAFSMRRRRREPLRAKTLKGYRSHYKANLSEHAARDVAWLAEHIREQVERIGAKPGEDGKPHPAIANQHLQIVKNLFEYLAREGRWPHPNPCLGIEKFAIDAREVSLTTADAARLYAAMQTEPEWIDLFLFLALTGRRLGNGQMLRWDWIDLPAVEKGRRRPAALGWIRYPTSSMKAKKSDAVQITGAVEEILRRRQAAALPGDEWVWPSFADRSKPVSNPHHAWERIRTLAKLPTLKIHELRHVAGTWASEGGATGQQVGSMLSHRDPRSTARYSHHGGQTAAPALEIVAEKWEQAAKKAATEKITKPPRKPRSDKSKAKAS
jgi:integrase